MSRSADLTGETFGAWTVLREGERSPSSKRRWWCRCDCGTERLVVQGNLRRGLTASCGCVGRHGLTGSPTHRSWRAMRQRCTNPNHEAYERYGGAGKGLHPRYESFENFLADLGERPEGMTLDRIDNSKGYEPGNLRWASKKTQSRNHSGARLTMAKAQELRARFAAGETQTALADAFGVSLNAVHSAVRFKTWT